ncbi:MAG: thioredoxin [Symbiobacterium sp.]|uniref:thioredoxin n=1 Tax=Symbiobacterium sp. TaxID=1971213 RepID=UPI003463FC42
MASDKVLTLSSSNWAAEVEQSAEPVLVDFWAAWCGPCRMIAPLVDEIASDYEGRLKVGKLNVDENNELAARYGVMSIPTLLIFKNGQPVERIVGFQPKKELVAKIDQALSQA